MTVPGGIASARAENAEMEDCLGERSEFELPVPICEQSDDSIGLSLRHRDELQKVT